MNLPIDIASTNPLKFKWQQKMDSLVGTRVQECEGALLSGVDVAVAELIALVKQQQQEIVGLQRQKNALEVLNSNQNQMIDLRKGENEQKVVVQQSQPAKKGK